MIAKRVCAVLAAFALTVSSIGLQFNGVKANAEEVTRGGSDKTSDASEEEVTIVGKADIVFAIDATGSMGSYIDSVKNNLTNFVNSLNSRGVELNMSIVVFKDITSDGVASTVYYDFDGSHWTADVDKVISAFNAISVYGGGDEPETPIDAFEKIEMPDDDANKFIFLLTDASFKDYEDTEDNKKNGHYSMEYWTEHFREDDVKVTVVSRKSLESTYNYLYRLTGGRFIDIDSSNYYELMQEYSEWIYEKAIDADGDGLPDEWEINGVDTDHDGVIDLDLPAMGADPKVPDIFIEADWMEDPGRVVEVMGVKKVVGAKDTSPGSAALWTVYRRFKNHGINIHIDAGPKSVMNYETGATWGSLSGASALPFQETFDVGDNYENWNKLALNNFTKARWTTFKYCLFANQYEAGFGNRSSGIAENLPGQFFIVASDCIGGTNRTTALAGTIMHELGHTLGLSHGGLHTDSSTGEVVMNHSKYKPNHLSIMNYTYQFKGLRKTSGSFVADYQNFDLPEIDENHINENYGIDPFGATAGTNLTINVPVITTTVGSASTVTTDVQASKQPIDWNKNTTLDDDISMDLNPKDNAEPGIRLLTDTINEWDNLIFDGGLIGGYGEEVDLEDITTLITKPEDRDEILSEVSIDEAQELGLLGDPGECQVADISAKSLPGEVGDQKLLVDIANLSADETTVTLTVSSEAFTEDHSVEVKVPKDGTVAEIPVAEKLTAGDYDITYTLTLENGETVTEKGSFNVSAPYEAEKNIGDEEELPTEDIISCVSSDDSVVEIADGKIVAKSEGTAYVSIVLDNNTAYTIKVTVVDPDSTTTEDEEETGDVNGKGSIDVADISKVAAHVKGIKELTEDEKKRADANKDGKIDVTDVALIAAHVKGKRSLS